MAASDSLSGIGFFCHSDVVSVDGWDCPHGGPFPLRSPTSGCGEARGMRYEGANRRRLDCHLAARSQLASRAPIYFFVTGDEECGMAGARLLTEQSEYYRELVEARGAGVICEPTALQVVNAHKGGCHLDVSSKGVAAHSSTAEGRNANWPLIPFLHFLGQLNARCESEARLQNARFSPPTMTLNLVIENQPQSTNITVGRATCRIFFRPMPATDWQAVLDEVINTAQQMQLQVRALPPLAPLDTPPDSPLVQTALRVLGQATPQVVSYATDGCCFEQLSELIVIGPGNIDQAHRPDEWIELEQLQRGVDVYQSLLEHYASKM
ncbi:MAG: M20/M25/M40 family metallo-hydrolase [Pirellulaceae bacterium]